MSADAGETRSAATSAFRLLLRPLIRMLLRAGVTWQTAASLLKAEFVAVATEDYGLHGRPTNISRVAILTGVSRREVSRLRKAAKGSEPEPLRRLNDATRVLTGWHLDPDFASAGQPRTLPFEGGPGSFTDLARRYAGDIPAVTMLRELLRAGAVAKAPDGHLTALTRYYMPNPLEPGALLQAGGTLRDLGDAIEHNLTRGPATPSRLVGRATNTRIPARHRAAFRDFLQARGQAFLEEVDEWLSRHELAAADGGRRLHRLGVGVFHIEDLPPDGPATDSDGTGEAPVAEHRSVRQR